MSRRLRAPGRRCEEPEREAIFRSLVVSISFEDFRDSSADGDHCRRFACEMKTAPRDCLQNAPHDNLQYRYSFLVLWEIQENLQNASTDGHKSELGS